MCASLAFGLGGASLAPLGSVDGGAQLAPLGLDPTLATGKLQKYVPLWWLQVLPSAALRLSCCSLGEEEIEEKLGQHRVELEAKAELQAQQAAPDK